MFVSSSGVGFSFLCSWVLMGIVTTLFVVGGNVEKLLCEPLANRQLFKVRDMNPHLNSSLSVCFGRGPVSGQDNGYAHEYTRVCL